MIEGFFLGGCILVAASSLGLMEKALGPDTGRFPCVSKELIWCLRLYTLCLATRAFVILLGAYRGDLPDPTIDQLYTGFIMASSHLLLLVQIIRQRLPIGVWRRLQARHERVRRLSKTGTKAGAVMARAIADVDPVVPAPMLAVPTDLPADMAAVLDRMD